MRIKLSYVLLSMCFGFIFVMNIVFSNKLNSIDLLVAANSNAILNLGEYVLNDNSSDELNNLKKQEITELMMMLGKNYHLNDKIKKSVASLTYFWASHYNLHPKLVMSIILVESSGNPSAVSNRDAKGLMQVTKLHSRVLDPYLIENNIMIGTTYLSHLIRLYGIEGGIKRYFCGETNKSCLNNNDANNYLKKVTGFFQ